MNLVRLGPRFPHHQPPGSLPALLLPMLEGLEGPARGIVNPHEGLWGVYQHPAGLAKEKQHEDQRAK